MQVEPIVIFGAGGFAREVLDLLRDINCEKQLWNILGFIDDNPSTWGTHINDLPVLGGTQWLNSISQSPFMALGVGSPVTKYKVATHIRTTIRGFPPLVHPSVIASPYVTLGQGAIIAAGTILTNRISIGDFAMLNLACTVGHDCSLGQFVSVSPGTNISGNVQIGDGCDIGTGTKIIQGITISEWTVVGAGSVVTHNIPANCTAVGVPAKAIKQREVGWHQL